MKMHNCTPEKEQVLVFSIKDREYEYLLKEMICLVENLFAEVVVTVTMNKNQLNPYTYIGKGKIEEIKGTLAEFNVKLVVVNDNLTPSQKRELEEAFNVKVLDRTEIILEIFASRASTREAKLQVEVASYEYLKPRLTRMWSHLSRQQGGVGVRGIGEKQIETDKRIIKKKIQKLKEELEEVKKNRSLQRKKRINSNEVSVALVGYTNAGKSSLFNYFKGKTVFAKDQLFATLDTVTKRVEVANTQFYLVDTVGFITNLPHFLVDSFKATLEEVLLSDILINVIDAADENNYMQAVAVEQILKELGINDKAIIKVYNKCDLLPKKLEVKDGLVISVKTGENMDELINAIKYQIDLIGKKHV